MIVCATSLWWGGSRFSDFFDSSCIYMYLSNRQKWCKLSDNTHTHNRFNTMNALFIFDGKTKQDEWVNIEIDLSEQKKKTTKNEQDAEHSILV